MGRLAGEKIIMKNINALISTDLSIKESQVQAAVELLSSGATIPFVARYRKEATGGLDEVQIANVWDRFEYLRELGDRKETVLSSIEAQGKLTEELKARILDCATKTELEDLYLPYKPKRKTRADAAREKGLEPLALRAMAQEDEHGSPLVLAGEFVNAELGVETPEDALSEAGYIVAETVAQDADARAAVRELTFGKGLLVSHVREDKASERSKFETYYDYEEKVSTIPSHRFMAIRRGEEEGVLKAGILAPEEEILFKLQTQFIFNPNSIWRAWLGDCIKDAYQRLLAHSIEVDVRVELKNRSDVDAIEVFAENLRNLLLDSPAGRKKIIAVDPGFRTGCKVVALSEFGDFIEWKPIYPHPPQKHADEAASALIAMIERNRPEFIVIGNGTAGRETEAFVKTLLKEHPAWTCRCLTVSEAGASVYSASEIAREEFPELDVTVRGAISIGRRFQDPLSELVKIEAKSIGVGQYQHDVNQVKLRKELDRVVESCVNSVGVDVNTASISLLKYVSGVGETLAGNIVAHRRENGAFASRNDLKSVPRLGPKAFEQAAGFMRISGAANPLDSSAVHPERYNLVKKMAKDKKIDVASLVRDDRMVDSIEPSSYVGEDVGLPTIIDILEELKKPGRDPRKTFDPVTFDENIREIEDVKEGMILSGVVTNVAKFGAFVDIGVHQDGLVHISELADRFVKEPSDVVSVGQKVTARVVSVDVERKRIALSLKSPEASERVPQAAKQQPRGQANAKAKFQPKVQAKPQSQPKSKAPAKSNSKAAPKPETKAQSGLQSWQDQLSSRFKVKK